MGRLPFRRGADGVVATFTRGEVRLLDSVFADLDDLLAQAAPAPASGADPLDALVGIAADPGTPDDPALARLLPDAYPQDPAAAAEYRRYARSDLTDYKRQALARVRADLATGPGRRVLDDAGVEAWLTALTDLRLVVAERVGVRTEQDAQRLDRLSRDDERRPIAELYGYLGALQETLVQAAAGW